MRQLTVLLSRGKGPRALQIARSHGGMNLLCCAGEADQPLDALFITVPNAKLDPLLEELQSLDDIEVSFAPQGAIALKPPASGAAEQVKDVSSRSPLEVFLGGIQSIGSWNGFLGYSAAGAVVSWVGLHTNTIYLLTAAMLISPYAGPAMNLALGTARGDRTLIGRSLLRYVASIALSILLAFVLSQVMQQQVATEMMVQTSLISSVSLLLPLTAGAAGALNLCQSERNSLVTAAGPGMLVAASLAPPAANVGMAMAIADWDMVKSGLFLLLTQLVGINLSGALVFGLFGLSPTGVRYSRGRNTLRYASFACTALALGGLLTWQFWSQPELQRSTRTQRLAADVRDVISKSELAHAVDVNVRFTRADIPQQNTLLAVVYLQRKQGVTLSDEDIRQALTERLEQRLKERAKDVTALIDVRVLHSADDKSRLGPER